MMMRDAQAQEPVSGDKKPKGAHLTTQHQSRAGKALVAKRGRAYMAELGRAGYAATIARHPNFHVLGGNASWRKQNRAMLDAGYFPNQSAQQWGYCLTHGCSSVIMGGGQEKEDKEDKEEDYCPQHRHKDSANAEAASVPAAAWGDDPNVW